VLPPVTIPHGDACPTERAVDGAVVVAQRGTDSSQRVACSVELDGLCYFGWCHPLVTELDTMVPE